MRSKLRTSSVSGALSVLAAATASFRSSPLNTRPLSASTLMPGARPALKAGLSHSTSVMAPASVTATPSEYSRLVFLARVSCALYASFGVSV
ncbi:hypothetical protein D9M72_597510 [compost metagenome]